MTNVESVVAVIPLRSGSKSIPNKNIKVMGGRPLCHWVLEAACQCTLVDAVFVSTDSEAIADVVHAFSKSIEIVWRPAELASDTATTESVMLHFAESCEFKTLVTIQATTPQLRARDLTDAIKSFASGGYDSMLSGVIEKRFYWSLGGTPLNYDPIHRPRRQEWDGTLVENGAFYITNRELLMRTGCRLGGRIGIYGMPPNSLREIDEPSDWNAVESELVRFRSNTIAWDAVKLMVVDVDGTLTDGGMYFGSEGEIMKKFNTRDAVGLRNVMDLGVDVQVVTRENSPCTISRAAKLQIPLHSGILDKRRWLELYCSEKSIVPWKVLMVGDDINDLEAMNIAGLSACPGDAAAPIRKRASFISGQKGGEGAVREICDLIVDAIRKESKSENSHT